MLYSFTAPITCTGNQTATLGRKFCVTAYHRRSISPSMSLPQTTRRRVTRFRLIPVTRICLTRALGFQCISVVGPPSRRSSGTMSHFGTSRMGRLEAQPIRPVVRLRLDWFANECRSLRRNEYGIFYDAYRLLECVVQPVWVTTRVSLPWLLLRAACAPIPLGWPAVD